MKAEERALRDCIAHAKEHGYTMLLDADQVEGALDAAREGVLKEAIFRIQNFSWQLPVEHKPMSASEANTFADNCVQMVLDQLQDDFRRTLKNEGEVKK